MISRKNPSSRPHVLVVEDEFFSRIHAVDLVETAGYNATEASNADEAIAILETRKDIRIVFTDIDMPGSMDGLKLARKGRLLLHTAMATCASTNRRRPPSLSQLRPSDFTFAFAIRVAAPHR